MGVVYLLLAVFFFAISTSIEETAPDGMTTLGLREMPPPTPSDTSDPTEHSDSIVAAMLAGAFIGAVPAFMLGLWIGRILVTP